MDSVGKINPFDIFLEETSPINTPNLNQPRNQDLLSFQTYDTQPAKTTGFAIPEQLHEDLQQTIPIREQKPIITDPVADDDQNDPPLLDDLGINLQDIKNKAITVVTLKKDEAVTNAPDLTGPLVIAIILGFLLLLSGSIHFANIIGVSICGSLFLYLLLNFMSNGSIIPVYTVLSVLGYCQAPMLLLGFLKIFTRGNVKELEVIMGIGISVWSAMAASLFFQAILQLQNKRWLIGYPVFLFYIMFVEIIIF